MNRMAKVNTVVMSVGLDRSISNEQQSLELQKRCITNDEFNDDVPKWAGQKGCKEMCPRTNPFVFPIWDSF